jgi:DNA helicase-2/ATP-dependent DNA helicase PcrA
MKYSKYQEAVFSWITDGQGSKVVEAVAGSGKTTTIVEAANRIPSNFRCLFLAFNKSIAEELKSRLPAHVEARTMNSLGAGIVFKHAGRRSLTQDKLDRVVKETITRSELGSEFIPTFKFPLRCVVRCMKNLGVRPDELVGDTWVAIREQVIAECDDLDAEFLESWEFKGQKFFEVLSRLASLAIDVTVRAEDIDFDDQIYLPIYHGWKLRPYDFIFVDESQDLSPSNRKLLKLVSNRYTRFCFVGDSRQAIYSFRGADSRSLQAIKEEFGADSLPLSICYRCPKDVVRMAQGLAPEIEYHGGNEDGKVSVGTVNFNPDAFKANDLIVCRLNAPLVRAAIQLAKKGKRCVILGRDFGRSLSNLVRSFKARKIEYIPQAAESWMKKKVAAFVSMGKDEDSAAVREVMDRYEALMFFFEELAPTDVEGFCYMIEQRFSDKEDGISTVLATVHKAKGKEYDRVFILNAGSIGGFKGKGADQEANIMYVAVTRAKKELGFVDIGETKPSGLFNNMIESYMLRKAEQVENDRAFDQPNHGHECDGECEDYYLMSCEYPQEDEA